MGLACREAQLDGVKMATRTWDHHIFSSQFTLFFFFLLLMGIAQIDTARVVPTCERMEVPALGAVWGAKSCPQLFLHPSMQEKGMWDNIIPVIPLPTQF